MAISLAFSRLCLNNITRTLHRAPQLQFHSTPILCAEPLKKKKKMDPAIIKAREDRRKKKIEKQIRRLEKHARQLKPIDELEIPLTLIDERAARTRPKTTLSAEEVERRALLQKSWARYKLQQKVEQYEFVEKLLYVQEKALNELRLESEELYQEAIQPDPFLVPFKAAGPVTTPPVEKYQSPDGDYIDISKKWE